MKWNIRTKLIALGVVSCVTLLILFSLSKIVNGMVDESSMVSIERGEQIRVVYEMRQATTELVLVAMDVIIDKDAESDRLDELEAELLSIIARINPLKDLLVKAADTDEESRLAKEVVRKVEIVAHTAKNDLMPAVRNKAPASEFVKFDDVLDGTAVEISDALVTIGESISEEVAEANENLHSSLDTSSFVSTVVFICSILLLLVVLVYLVKNITASLNKVTETLQASSDQVATVSVEMASSSQVLSEGASNQASGLEELSSTVEEIASQTKQNASNASNANSQMATAKTVTENGKETMDRLVKAIEGIKVSADKTSNIVKGIEEIAFQTNLLALNAAVEAARAGDAGKGFAVVAEEVRNLAQRASEAARNTGELIQESMDSSESGVVLAEEANGVISEVNGKIADVAVQINEISASSVEQTQGIEQINAALSDLEGVTQKNAANAEESAASSEELSAQAQDLKSVVQELMIVSGSTDGDDAAYNTVYNEQPTGYIQR